MITNTFSDDSSDRMWPWGMAKIVGGSTMHYGASVYLPYDVDYKHWVDEGTDWTEDTCREAAPSDGHDARRTGQPPDFGERSVVAMLRIMRMKSYRRPHVVVLAGDRHSRRSVLRISRRNDETANALLSGASECPVRVGHREVAVGIREPHQARSTSIDKPMPPLMQSVARPMC